MKEGLDSKIKEKTEEKTERIHTTVDSVKYKYNRTDPEGAVLICVVALTKVLMEKKLPNIVNDKDHMVLVLESIEDKLQSPVIRENVRYTHAAWS